jgi:hypothetical protein
MIKLILIVYLCFVSVATLGESFPPKCNPQAPAEPFAGVIPKNFILIPLCENSSIDSKYDSRYIFLGDATINGTIEYENTETYGPQPIFVVDGKSEMLLPANIAVLRLDGEGAADAQNAFKLPKLTSAVTCWIAPAKIRVRYIDVQVDAGTDAAGTYLMDYTVLTIGRFEHCKSRN